MSVGNAGGKSTTACNFPIISLSTESARYSRYSSMASEACSVVHFMIGPKCVGTILPVDA